MLGLHFTPVCVLLLVCSLHFTHSLHFTPGPQSPFYTDRLLNLHSDLHEEKVSKYIVQI